ncbi:MAG TPA: VanZ family protein [Rubricoccaceae bacterium]|nr:VanZ family protein [Rubricoccaceae bacterium]
MPERFRPAALPLALLWTLALVVGLSLPGDELPDLSVLSADKLLHAGAFFGLGVLWLWAYPRAAGRILAAGLAFAVLSEVYQHLMPIDRLFSLYDALADAVGLALGLGAGTWWQRRRAAASNFRGP